MAEAIEAPVYVDPLEAHQHREPMKGAGVCVLVFDSGDPARAEVIANGLLKQLQERGRGCEAWVLESDSERGRGPTLSAAVAGTAMPLVLVTSATEPWQAEHLDRLLEAIDIADHAVGRRRGMGRRSFSNRLGSLFRRVLFAAPVVDVESPCQLHRREALARIPLQSHSAYYAVELYAKATFLAQLINEVEVPGLAGDERPSGRMLWGRDRAELLKRPRFRAEAESAPSEHAKGQEEGDGGPGGKDQE